MEAALNVYRQWRSDILAVNGEREEVLRELVAKLNVYKKYIDLDLVFGSTEDWLYRQKGQTKIDNSIIEEFLPVLVLAVFREKLSNDIYELGPTKCFSSFRFDSNFTTQAAGAGGDGRQARVRENLREYSGQVPTRYGIV